MTFQTVLLLLLTGLAAGILGGLVGVGGGVIIVPALIYFLGFNQLEAQGTSLGILVLPVGALAVLNYYKNGYIDVKIVLLVAAAFLIGGWLGSKISLSIPVTAVKRIFGALLLLLSIKMLFIDK